MKLKYLLPVALFAFAFAACEDDTNITPDPMAQSTVLDMPEQETYILDKDQEIAFTLSWTPNAPDLANPSYVVEMDSTGHNFSKAVILGTSDTTKLSVKTADLQKILRDSYGLNELNSTKFDIRVTTMYGVNRIPSSVSNPISLTLVPHSELPVHLYAVGSFNNWDVANALEFTKISDGVFEITINLNPDDEYKFVQVRQWDAMQDFSPSTSTLDEIGTINKGGNSPKFTGEAGAYKIKADFNTMKTVITYGNIEPLYIIGSVLEKGWDNSSLKGLMYRDSNEPAVGQYTYTGYFNAGEFKIISGKDIGTWDNLYGNGGDGKLSQDGGNLSVSTAGYYTLDVNIKAMTYSITPYDASAAQAYTLISLTGKFANDWKDDADLGYEWMEDTHNWIADVEITPGEVKYRLDHDWTTSWGGPNAGYGKSNNDNISIDVAGTYTVKFNDLTKHYIIIEKK